MLLPSGTSSIEALHAEIKTWFAQTQQMHQSPLILKLRVLKYAKQLPHFIALKHPTLSQMSSQLLLVRLVAVSMWRDVTWTAWCKTTVENAVVAKAKVPLHEARVEEACCKASESCCLSQESHCVHNGERTQSAKAGHH